MEFRSGHLIAQFALKDFKIRYTHSALGYAWSVLNPLLFTLIYFLVFSVFARFNIPNYPGYLLLGIVLWTFFAEGTTNGVSALMTHSGIVSKVPMPRWVVVCAAIANAIFTLAISLVILFVLLLATGTRPGWTAVIFPLLLLDLIAVALGLALILAPLHVRYHDIGYLWGMAVQIGFWLTPIIYHDLIIPERWRWLLTYNPLARIILYSREALLYDTWPDGIGVAKTTAFAFTVLIVGMLAFRRLQLRSLEYY